MTNKEINKLIADTLDITDFHETVTGFWGNTKDRRNFYCSYSNEHAAIIQVPDFANSLDAIREHLENSMTGAEKDEYEKICGKLPILNSNIFLTPIEKCYAYLVLCGAKTLEDIRRLYRIEETK